MPSPKADAAPSESALVRELADILNDTGLTEIELEREGLKIRVAKTQDARPGMFVQASAPVAPPLVQATTPAAAAEGAEPVRAGEVINSPMVGTVYLQAQPGAPVFAKLGDTVTAGQTLLLVEAMKTMNPITAPKAGRVLELLVGDGQPVEYGEPLIVIG